MHFDALCVAASVDEINAVLPAHVDRVRAGSLYEFILDLYRQGRQRLLVSLHPRWARLHLLPPAAGQRPEDEEASVDTSRAATTTAVASVGPPSAAWSPFVAMLRHALEGGTVVRASQRGWDRVVDLVVVSPGELGEKITRTLSIELMGRNTNAILIADDGRVIDANRRSGFDNPRRLIMPGQPYAPPPSLPGVPLATASSQEAALSLSATLQGSTSVLQAVLAAWQGPGPTVATALLSAAGIPAPDIPPAMLTPEQVEALVREATKLGEIMARRAWQPVAWYGQDGLPAGWAAVDIPSVFWKTAPDGRVRVYPSIAVMSASVYPPLVTRESLAAAAAGLRQELHAAAERLGRRLQALRQDLAQARSDLELDTVAQLLTANLYRLPAEPSETVILIDYFDESLREMVVPLPPGKTPAAAAQEYFRRVQKARRAVPRLEEEIARLEERQAAAEDLFACLGNARALADIEAVRARAERLGLREVRPPAGGRGGVAPRRRVPAARETGLRRFRSTDGFEIVAGRNNRANETLSLRLARPDDLWFHVQGYAGSHVVVRVPPGQDAARVPTRTIEQAAALAAYFSKARESPTVSVDYTLCRHVRKVAGTRPGQVVYDHQRTVVVRPDPALVEALALDREG